MRIFKTLMKVSFFNYNTKLYSKKINIYEINMSKVHARPILLNIQDNQCLMCNKKFCKRVPHEIHHIDHNSKNNVLSNFVALCSNCHSGHHRYNLTFPQEKLNNILLENSNNKELLEYINNYEYKKKNKKKNKKF